VGCGSQRRCEGDLKSNHASRKEEIQ